MIGLSNYWIRFSVHRKNVGYFGQAKTTVTKLTVRFVDGVCYAQMAAIQSPVVFHYSFKIRWSENEFQGAYL
jgi:hypothetical protein